MTPMVRYGRDLMGNNSAIEEYFIGSRNAESYKEVSNKELRDLIVQMRYEQGMLLETIRQESKPNFPRDVGANLLGSAIFDGLIFIGSKLIK